MVDKNHMQSIKTQGSVPCSPRKPGHATDTVFFTREKKNPFSHIHSLTLPEQKYANFSVQISSG